MLTYFEEHFHRKILIYQRSWSPHWKKEKKKKNRFHPVILDLYIEKKEKRKKEEKTDFTL